MTTKYESCPVSLDDWRIKKVGDQWERYNDDGHLVDTFKTPEEAMRCKVPANPYRNETDYYGD
jgi:hypothetical protein